MTRFKFAAAIASLALGLASAAYAGTTTTYYVGSLSNTPGSAAGYDPDAPAPAVTQEGFYASGTTGQYESVRFTPDQIGLSGLTLADIASIAYDHAQAGGGIDWQLKVYTVGSTGWYGYRLNYDLSTANADGSFSTFTSDNADAERIKPFGVPDIYSANQASLFASTLTAAGSQQVLFFDISAGAQTGGYPFNTFLNDIAITTTAGNTSILAVAVPLPTAALSTGVLLAANALRRRR